MDTKAETNNKTAFGIILPIVLISYFLILLNNSLVFTSTVQIGQELHMNNIMVAWVSNAYSLTFGGFLALGARLGDIIGRRKVLLIGLIVFTMASFLVGISFNPGMLIAMRALQGIGGSFLAPATLALLMDYYEGKQLTKAIAYYGATAGIGSSLGLIIGGIISSYSSWRNGFYLDMVVGIILILMSIKFVHPKQELDSDRKIDWWGAITSVIGFSSLVYSINATSFRTVAIILTIISLVAFVLIENKIENPLMPLVIFKDNQRASALVARFFMLGASMAYFFLMPQAMQKVFGITPLLAAIGFLPLTVVQFIISLFVARLSFRFSNATVLFVGSLFDIVGISLGAFLGINSGYLLGIAIPMVLIGLGQGLLMSPMTVAGVAGVDDDIAGAASGVVNTVHQIGGAVGLSIVSGLVASISNPVTSINHAQFWMAILLIPVVLSAINIFRGPHE
ncbi:MFS transporter [Lactobacillus sp.]|uniref:MFS transporter n=1 Tax=Lactobacillus sp. TaxID=1591 RepID=UPI0019AFADB7|nr:MFS transporter [Lactobacillus sp.]MBD5430197.1 MFS transporter [Lactobacillus sp.]